MAHVMVGCGDITFRPGSCSTSRTREFQVYDDHMHEAISANTIFCLAVVLFPSPTLVCRDCDK
jgi:hypothetical protein